MNRICGLLLICCAPNLTAQTNSPSAPGHLFSAPQVGLRLSNLESDGGKPANANSRVLQLRSAQSRELLTGLEPATNAIPDQIFEATSPGGGMNGVSLQIYDRLEKGGYLTRPELPSEDRLDHLVNTIFAPDPIRFQKVSVSCTIVTAIKRKNPLCLLNPIFLDIRW